MLYLVSILKPLRETDVWKNDSKIDSNQMNIQLMRHLENSKSRNKMLYFFQRSYSWVYSRMTWVLFHFWSTAIFLFENVFIIWYSYTTPDFKFKIFVILFYSIYVLDFTSTGFIFGCTIICTVVFINFDTHHILNF